MCLQGIGRSVEIRTVDVEWIALCRSIKTRHLEDEKSLEDEINGRCGRRTVENERNKLVEMGRKIRLAGPAHRPDKESKSE